MTDIQQKMLDLLLEIDVICRRHCIEYYMAGGSVLGAVRHRGFIPWDDDIDIMMTRENFARFEAVCNKELADDREIITTVNTPCHTKVTIKFMDKTTSQFFRSQVLDTTGCGVSLDIFILDPLPSGEEAKEDQIAHYVVYNELLTPFFMVNERLYQYVPLYRKYEQEIREKGRASVMDKLYQRLFVDEPASSDQYLYRWGQQLLIYDRSLFGKPKYLMFEGHMLPVPEKTLDFLRATYGDSWKYLPAIQQRETHVSFYSMSVSYNNWLEDISPFLHRETVLADFVERKRLNVDRARPNHDITVMKNRMRALQTEQELKQDEYINAQKLAAMDMRERKSRLMRYYDMQLQSSMIKNQILIQLDDEMLALALEPLVQMGDYLKAEKIWKLRVSTGKTLTGSLKEIGKQIDLIHQCVRGIEDGCIEEVSPVVEQGHQAYPEQLELIKCYLYIALKTEGWGFSSEQQLREYLKQSSELYPSDCELAYLIACFHEKWGEQQAAEAYMALAKETNNGLILLALQQREEKEKNNGI